MGGEEQGKAVDQNHRRKIAHGVVREVLTMLGLTVTGVKGENTRVWPSGSLRAPASMPMAPLAPGLLSTKTARPKSVASRSPSSRARRSGGEPAGLGTIIRTGLEGKSWAAGVPALIAAATHTTSAMTLYSACMSTSVQYVSARFETGEDAATAKLALTCGLSTMKARGCHGQASRTAIL